MPLNPWICEAPEKLSHLLLTQAEGKKQDAADENCFTAADDISLSWMAAKTSHE